MGFLDNYAKHSKTQDSLKVDTELKKEALLDSVANITRLDENMQWMAESSNVSPDMLPTIEAIGEGLKEETILASGEAQTAHDQFMKKYDEFQASSKQYDILDLKLKEMEVALDNASKLAYPTAAEWMFGSNNPEYEANYKNIKKEWYSIKNEMSAIKDYWHKRPAAGGKEGTAGTFVYPGGAGDVNQDRRTEFAKLENLFDVAKSSSEKADDYKNKYISSYTIPGMHEGERTEDLLFEYDETMDEAFFKASTKF